MLLNILIELLLVSVYESILYALKLLVHSNLNIVIK